MFVDLTILEERGITDESLKKALAGDPLEFAKGPDEDPTTNEAKRGRLHFRIRNRVQAGRNSNFADYKVSFAIDQAWDTPFSQITPTLLSTFLDTNPNEAAVYSKFKEWGLDKLVTNEVDPKTGIATGKKSFNMQVFRETVVPLCRSYTTIRWAKIMNDRRLIPFLQYAPVKATTPLRVKCEALTDRVQVMSTQYGYYDVQKQAVLKMLQYGICLQFPKEEWHSEQQLKKADAEDVFFEKKKEDGTPVDVGDVIEVTTREGLRHHHSHPSRTFRDMAHPPHTFNSDSGCEFAGYWRIARYREVKNSGFWNTDKIRLGTVDLIGSNQLFFNSVYTACQMSVPCAKANTTTTGTLGGTADTDRENELAVQFYNTDYDDQGVLITEYFEKLIPSENGLGDYDYPVWFRFVVAGDGCTILYAAPLPYAPVVYYGYDADESRSKNPGMVVEIMPFQDQFSNILSQILLTAKQNLANLTLVDEDQLTEDATDRVKNIGEGLYRTLNIFGFSGKKAFRGQTRVADALQSFNLPKGNTAELINVLKTILDVLERVLVMSSHEVAQAASHEQTREEVRNIAQSTSSRLTFTSTPVDIAREAWKRQIYAGLMTYGDDDFYAHIPAATPLTREQLEKMGFSFVDKDEMKMVLKDPHARARIKKKFLAMPLWEFASTRDGEDRTSDKEVAVAMSQVVLNMLNNPLTAAAIGADQAIDLANQIAQKAGVDRDFKLRNTLPPGAGPSGAAPQDPAAAQEQLKQVVQAVMQALQPELQPLLAATKKNADGLEMLNQKINAKSPPRLVDYDSAPPSVRRQMESSEGWMPAIEREESPMAPEPPVPASNGQ